MTYYTKARFLTTNLIIVEKNAFHHSLNCTLATVPSFSLTLAAAPPPHLTNLLSPSWGHAAHPHLSVREIMAGGGPIWAAWPVPLFLVEPPPLSPPLLLSLVSFFLSFLCSNSISHCGIFCCLIQVGLVGVLGSRLVFFSLLKTKLVTPYRQWDLQRPWMFRRQRV